MVGREEERQEGKQVNHNNREERRQAGVRKGVDFFECEFHLGKTSIRGQVCELINYFHLPFFLPCLPLFRFHVSSLFSNFLPFLSLFPPSSPILPASLSFILSLSSLHISRKPPSRPPSHLPTTFLPLASISISPPASLHIFLDLPRYLLSPASH